MRTRHPALAAAAAVDGECCCSRCKQLDLLILALVSSCSAGQTRNVLFCFGHGREYDRLPFLAAGGRHGLYWDVSCSGRAGKSRKITTVWLSFDLSCTSLRFCTGRPCSSSITTRTYVRSTRPSNGCFSCRSRQKNGIGCTQHRI